MNTFPIFGWAAIALAFSTGAFARMAVFLLRGDSSRMRAYGAVIRMAWSA